SGAEVTLPLRPFYRSQATLLGSFMGSRWELLEALRWIGSGKVRPVVGATFPLEKAADAQRAMEARHQFGKIVLLP
ncbi:MAG: zinc-binding dehydrogenase, partial [Planctomycetes bacterium]|nr:zinc-binding dehydrogenase [Planctomycetota bacterium]